MVELVDTHALGACAARRTGSSPASGTTLFIKIDQLGLFLFFLVVQKIALVLTSATQIG